MSPTTQMGTLSLAKFAVLILPYSMYADYEYLDPSGRVGENQTSKFDYFICQNSIYFHRHLPKRRPTVNRTKGRVLLYRGSKKRRVLLYRDVFLGGVGESKLSL
jgi:hypothetical protein